MAAALPLAGVPAWRVYLGLPMFGARTPAGGLEEVMRLGAEDFVLKLFRPVVEQAAAEAPAAVAAFRAGLRIADAPISLVGGSTGTAVALLLLAEGELPVAAAALVSPVSQLAPAARCFDATYRWTDESPAVPDRFDFVARAGEIARRHPQPPMLLVTGARDLAEFREPAGGAPRRSARPLRRPRTRRPGQRAGDGPRACRGARDPARSPDQGCRADTHVTEWLRCHLGG